MRGRGFGAGARRLALIGAVAVLSSLLFAAAGSAGPLRSFKGSCGKAVRDPKQQSPTFVLQNDIGPCNSDGLIFQASNVTLDLNGYDILGTPLVPDGPDADAQPDGGFGEGVGIRLVGNSRVTITNSKAATDPSVIRDFDAGILIQRGEVAAARYNTVTNVVVQNNLGNQPFGGGDEESISDFSDGIVLLGAEFSTIGPNNTVVGNGSGGIRLDDGAVGNTVTGNLVQANGGNGIRFINFATDNLVTGNTSTLNSFAGVSISFSSPDNVIENNTLHANGSFGVSTGWQAERTTIRSNTITSNRSGGITLGSGENLVTGNQVVNNGRGITGTGRGNGIFVGSGTDNFPRVGTVVSNNVVTGSGGNGIRIGCMLDQDDPNVTGGSFFIHGCLVWDQHNEVVDNVATGNAVNGPSGTMIKDAPNAFNAGGQVVGFYDLLDSTNTDSRQSPHDPSGQPLTNCSNNVWSGNSFDTAFPACTTG